MLDYAISAISAASRDDHLINFGRIQDVRRFEELNTEAKSLWNAFETSKNQFRVIQEASHSGDRSKTAMPPLSVISSRLLDRIDSTQRDLDLVNRKVLSNSLNKASNVDSASPKGIYADQSYFQDMFKLQYHMTKKMVLGSLLTSIAQTCQSTISMLYKQQG
jgi:hypothetical protein